MAQGVEPDACFYIQNEAAVRGKNRIDLETDPTSRFSHRNRPHLPHSFQQLPSIRSSRIVALQQPQPANGRIAKWKIHTVRSQSPVSQLPHHRAHPPVFRTKQNCRQKRRPESLSILGKSANLAGR